MSKIYNNAKELIKNAPKDRPFQVRVESNPHGIGSPQILWAVICDDNLNTCMNGQRDINDVNYCYSASWTGVYSGTFELIEESYMNQFKKPEVYKVGDRVKILENAIDCGNFNDWMPHKINMINKIMIIDRVLDDSDGISYDVRETNLGHCVHFPYYCVQKAEDAIVELSLEDIAAKFNIDVNNLKIKK